MICVRWLVLLLALCLPILTSCGLPAQAEPQVFDELARRVPGHEDQAFFMDFKLGGEAGRRWERIRERLEADPRGQEGLRGILNNFGIEEFGLDELILGPAVTGYGNGANYTILQVGDGEAVEDALHQHLEGVTWEQEEFEGKTLHDGRIGDSWQQGKRLAWAIDGGLLYLAFSYNHGEPVLTQLQALLSLAEEDSLAALPAWQALRGRLPDSPMGLFF